MRYIIIFTDRTSKRVSAEQADIFRQAMRTRVPVDFKGATYAGYSIVAIKPIHAHEQDLRDDANDAGLFRCRYGRTHASKADCACRDAGFPKILEAEEERLLLEAPDNVARGLPPLADRQSQQDAKTLGFTDARHLHETKNTWTRVGDFGKRL